MALTCQWVQVGRGHYKARLNRSILEVRKVPRELKRYEAIVDSRLVGERTTLNGAKTAAIRIAQGGATYNRRAARIVKGRIFRRHGVDRTPQEAALMVQGRAEPAPPPQRAVGLEHRHVPTARRFADWIKEPDDTETEVKEPEVLREDVQHARQTPEPQARQAPAPAEREEAPESVSNLPALVVGTEEDDEILTFSMTGRIRGNDMADAISNLKSAVELLRTFAEVECSVTPKKGKL